MKEPDPAADQAHWQMHAHQLCWIYIHVRLKQQIF